MTKEKTTKAEYPLNSLGFGFDGTIAGRPFLLDQIEYSEPLENYRYQFCGACAFYINGLCAALSNEVHILASCKLYLPMDVELSMRHEAIMLRLHNNSSADKGVEIAKGIETLQVKKAEEKVYSVDVPQELVDELEASFKASEKSIEVVFKSVCEEKQIVYGIVLEADEIDYHGDTITAEEIEKSAHNYALTPMMIGDSHIKQAKARPVETFIYDPKILENVKPGSWVMAIKVDDAELWKGVKDGTYTGLSIGAMVKRTNLADELSEEGEE